MIAQWTSQRRPLDAVRIFRAFTDHSVQYIVVGGLAAIAHGYSGATRDADAVPAIDLANLERLALALISLNAVLYAHPNRSDLRDDGSPPEAQDFVLTGDHLGKRLVWQFITDAGPIDIMLIIDGPGGYDVLSCDAETRTVGGSQIMIASLDNLIESKEAAARSKDLRALDELRSLRDKT